MQALECTLIIMCLHLPQASAYIHILGNVLIPVSVCTTTHVLSNSSNMVSNYIDYPAIYFMHLFAQLQLHIATEHKITNQQSLMHLASYISEEVGQVLIVFNLKFILINIMSKYASSGLLRIFVGLKLLLRIFFNCFLLVQMHSGAYCVLV